MRIVLCKKSLQILFFISVIFVGLFTLISLHSVSIDRIRFAVQTEKYHMHVIPSCISNQLSNTELNITTDVPSWEELRNETWSKNIRQGYWFQTECKRNDAIAIIIPYREREEHLRKILSHLHPFLQRQMASYQIIVVEQSSKGIFNKGALINAGFKIANSIPDRNFTCFIFHDVDMLPIKDQNIYQCIDNPLHLGAAVDKFEYRLAYSTIVGGVLAMTTEQFKKVNGFSNMYEGWGGEDDEMAERIRTSNYKIIRYPDEVAQYNMIKHDADKGNPINPKRKQYLNEEKRQQKNDGLSNISFEITKYNFNTTNLAYWIVVNVPDQLFFQISVNL